MKRNITPLLLIFVLAGLIGGCGQLSNDGSITIAGAVALVDLDKVAASTGRDQQMNQAIKQKETELNAQLEAQRVALESQISDRMSVIGDEPTDPQKAELQTLQLDVRRKLLTAQQQAKNQLLQERARLIGEFRAEIQPVIHQVAVDRKFVLVLAWNDAMVLAFDSAIDITDAIIDGLADTDTTPAPK
jgi:Skp family chaperone for outer membrane proteins